MSDYYEFQKFFYKKLFEKSLKFEEIADNLGYHEDFLIQIIQGKIPISTKELDSILEELGSKRKDIILDKDFLTTDGVSSSDKALSLFLDIMRNKRNLK